MNPSFEEFLSLTRPGPCLPRYRGRANRERVTLAGDRMKAQSLSPVRRWHQL